MQSLQLVGPGQTRWVDAPEPTIDDDEQAIVEPLAVATCDLDVGVLRGVFPAPGAPYPLGHESIGRVVEVGDAVTTIEPGDRVVIPFQISCGRCEPCLAGRTGNCRAHPPMSTYGLGDMGGKQWGGHLADRIAVPHAEAMLVPVPPAVTSIAAASCSDNIADAWRTVGPHLAAQPGADVLVVGGDGGPNSIGLYAAGLAVHLGAGRVVYVDVDADRGERAARLGAEVEHGATGKRVGSFPITVDASGSEVGLHTALHSTAADGVCTSPSVYLGDVAMPLLAMYSRCCTFHTGRAHARPAIPEILTAIEAGFDPEIVTTDVVPWEAATDALADPTMKMIIHRPDASSP